MEFLKPKIDRCYLEIETKQTNVVVQKQKLVIETKQAYSLETKASSKCRPAGCCAGIQLFCCTLGG